ncbi:tRNA (adenosine(37)-N6)-threonylcarbamoyltransferase complex dimerization subunit type 1 TsaB, partial [Methylobacterium sp. WL18]
PDITAVASLGLVADPAQALPRPLYLRGADARPQDHARIARQ